MRLPLVFDKARTRLSVVATVGFSGRPAIPVSFIVDTGSPFTFVDEFNSAKVRIFTKSLEFDCDALMGGTKVAMYKTGGVIMKFRDEADGLIEIKYAEMKVAQTEWTRRETTYSAASILGLDFLLENKLSLHVDPAKELAYIEAEAQKS